MKLLALSLHQPWASLIATGAKTIETRSWYTKHRGPLVICASKARRGPNGSWTIMNFLEQPEFQAGLATLRRPTQKRIGIESLPFGQAVALVDVANCRPTEFLTTDEIGANRPFGDFGPDRYAWMLENIRPLTKAIPVRGFQGLFFLDEETSEAIKDALKQ